MSRRTLTIAEYQAAVAADMSERDELMPQVIRIAQQLGWDCYHTHSSEHSEDGFPDIIAIRGPRLLAIECKREQTARGRKDREPTPKQRYWLALFAGVPGCESVLWRPSDLLSGRIHEALS